MKKVLRVLVLVLGLFLAVGLTGCDSNKYEAEAGKYECYYITMNGVNVTNQYEYYTVELKANGKCVVKSKQVGAESEYSSNAKFEIENEKITVVTSILFYKVTEEYEYVNGEIIMDTVLDDVTVYAKFRRN